MVRAGMIHFRKAAALFFLLSLLSFAIPGGAGSADTPPGLKQEADHLLAYIEKSGCEFYRNGKWYKDAKAVRDHVDMKYHYFIDKKTPINSAEDFVRWSATKSEISGKPYLVKCSNGPELPLGPWLLDELARFRKANPPQSKSSRPPQGRLPAWLTGTQNTRISIW
jgi:hypothetical protein